MRRSTNAGRNHARRGYSDVPRQVIGKARYEVFDADMRASVMARLQLETDLHRALSAANFQFLPANRLSGIRRDHGLRVLLRWHHPTRGHLGPEEFIAVAEETGSDSRIRLVEPARILPPLRLWRKNLSPNTRLVISVNLSTKQFVQPNLVENIAAC